MEVTPIITTVASLASSWYMKESADTQKKALKAERAANQKKYDLDVAQAKLALAEEQRKNLNLLTQQQSAYKAKLGAAGMSPKSGSGEAVLESLQKEHDAEDKYLVNQANISLEALLNGINARNTQNLLSLSSASSRNTANALNSINTFTSAAGRSVLK
ncbi:MAG: hypothetical protein IKS41_00610 [Alphaproteobacteria bacterium]|nr:hypothetical protein [Alphaproteobacteria bacterium]